MTLFRSKVFRIAVLSVALCCPVWAESITYNVSIDTSSFTGSTGVLGFLLTDFDGAANTEAQIADFDGAEEGLISVSLGDVEGSLHDGLRLGDGQWFPLSSYFEFGVVYTDFISFDLTWDTTSTADTFTAVLINSPVASLFTLAPQGVQSANSIVTVSNGPAPTRVPEGTGVELPLVLVGLAFASWQKRAWLKDVAT